MTTPTTTITFGEAEAAASDNLAGVEQQFTVHVPLLLHQLKKDAMKVRMADPQINFDLFSGLQPVKLK